jgi:hypothetical protein
MDRDGEPAKWMSTLRPARLARASIVVAAPVAYFCHVFQVFGGRFWTSGLSAWLDPYFLNYLLEHWYYSIRHFTDPASPPMYFPVRGTLGYSCGLILYAPFYLIVRPFLHPFPAYSVALMLVMVTGSLSLYAIFRKFIALGFVESLALTVFFFSSSNVANPWHTNVWSQTASVFLVPAILLLTLTSARMWRGWPATSLAALSGLMWTLLFTQDFYTGWFCLLLLTLLTIGAILVFGIGRTRIIIELLVHHWKTNRPRIVAFVLGAGVGSVVFLWVYLDAYLQYDRFPQEQLMAALIPRSLSGWRDPVNFLGNLVVYASRTFELVFLVGILVWIPWFKIPIRIRLFALWFLLISAIVVLGAVKFDEYLGWKNYSVWKRLFHAVPGYNLIRDPKRIINTYELAAVLVTGLFLAQLPRRALLRVATVALLVALVVREPNRDVFTYERSNAVFDRWVSANIDIDPSCRGFFIKGASEEYTSRYGDMWGLYGIDAMFIALQRSLPTLNGYSAWTPPDWGLANPLHPGYLTEVRRWIARHDLEGICQLDIDARTMTPFN